MKSIRAVMVLECFLALGCTLTKYDAKKPQMFEENLEALRERYEGIKINETTWGELEASGFRFGDSNIRIVPGADAVRVIFGENVFQGVVRSPEQLDAFLKEFSAYKLIIIPHKDLNELTDRFYFSTKETWTKGHDIKFLLVFKDSTVVYKAKDVTFVDEYQLRSAFGQGILDLLGLVRDTAKPIEIPNNPVKKL